MTSWSFKKNWLDYKDRLILKFMTSQPGYQTITKHILPNISQTPGGRETSSRLLFVL